MEVFYADWPEGVAKPQLQIVSQVATQDRHFDITRRGAVAERTEVLRRCLQASSLVPIDGIVRSTAERAIGRIKDPVAQGKAIYEWVVENTTFDPLLKSVGNVNIGSLLESGNLSGRSGDIALLFVAPVPIDRDSGTTGFRSAHRQFATVWQPRRQRQPEQRTTLPRRVLHSGLWLDSGSPLRCPQSHS